MEKVKQSLNSFESFPDTGIYEPSWILHVFMGMAMLMSVIAYHGWWFLFVGKGFWGPGRGRCWNGSGVI